MPRIIKPILIILLLLAAYPLSFGPACWWFSKDFSYSTSLGMEVIAPKIYWPIGWVMHNYSGTSLAECLRWYAYVGARGKTVLIYAENPWSE